MEAVKRLRQIVSGNRERFAIEAHYVCREGGWIHGSLGVWVAGARLGKPEDTANLAASARAGRIFLEHAPGRLRADLWLLPKEALFERLYGRWIVFRDAPTPPGRDLEVELGSWDDTFVLDGVGDSALLDAAGIVAVASPTRQSRIVAMVFPTKTIVETVVDRGELELLIGRFCDWVDELSAED